MKIHSQKIGLKRLRERSAFTLVELLVGIAIIATLALVVTMMARNSMKKARVANGMNAMRQVATANVQFSQDNQFKVNTLRWVGDPQEGGKGGKGGYVANSYWGRLSPYLFPDLKTGNQGALAKDIKLRLNGLFSTSNCDKMTGTILDGSPIYHDGSTLPVPFAFNSQLYTWNNWERVSKVTDAAQVMYTTYGFGIFNEEDGQTSGPMPPAGTKPSNNIYYVDNGKAMVSFLDGHVEFIGAPIPTRRFKID